MFKLFKEVFKSLFKNKITLFCLSILIFLTTVVFSTLFSVKESFSRSIQIYNKTSVLHDATVDLDINLANENNKNLYELSSEEINNNQQLKKKYTSKKEVYIPKNPKDEPFAKFSLYFNKENFIKLSDLGVEDENKDRYILTNEFINEFENSKFSNKESTFFHFDLDNFKNLNFQPINAIKIFKLFNSPDLNDETKKEIKIKKNDILKLDKIYRFNEIVNIIDNGSSEKNGTIKSVKQLGINLLNNEATFDIVKINSLKNTNILKLLSEEETAKYIGLVKKNNLYELSKESSFKSELFDWNKIATTSSEKILFKKPSGESKIEFKFLGNDFSTEINKYFNFELNKSYKLKKENVVKLQQSIKYIKYSYTLPDIDDPNIQSKISPAVLEYLLFLKDNNFDEFNKLNKIYYWKKVIENRINNEKPTETLINLSKIDLLKEIYLETDTSKKSTSIAKIENIGNSNNVDFLTEIELAKLSNDKIADIFHNKIINEINPNISDIIYKYLVENNKFVDKIGRRQFKTVNVFDSTLNNKEIVYQFINSGINNNNFSENQKHEVGKLFFETLNQDNKSRLFVENSLLQNINKEKIPLTFVPKIIEKVYGGFITDPNYIDLDVKFIKRKFLSENSLYDLESENEKIILLKSEIDIENNLNLNTKKYNKFAIGKNENGYLTYGKIINSEQWEIFKYKNKEFLDQNELADFILENKLNLEAKIKENGWYRQSFTSKNNFYIPFIYRVPVSNAFDEIKNNKKSDILFDIINQFLLNSELVELNFLDPNNLDIFIKSLNEAFISTNFYKVLTNPSSSEPSIRRLFFEAFYIAINKHDERFVNEFIKNIFNGIKQKILFKNSKDNSFNTPEEQHKIIKEEILKINKLLSLLGIDSLNNFLNNFDIDTLGKIIKNPINFINSIEKLANSIDYKYFFEQMHIWEVTKENQFKIENENTKDEKRIYYYFSQADLLIPLFEALNFEKFKIALSEIVDEISIDYLLSTKKNDKTDEYTGFLLNKLASIYKEASEKDIKLLQDKTAELLNKININKNNGKEDYINVKTGIKSLVSILDKETLLLYIKSSQIKHYFYNEKDNKNYEVNVIKKGDVIASFILSYFRDSNTQNHFQETLINLLNASGSTKKVGFKLFGIGAEYSAPERDDQKFSVFDISNISAFSNINNKLLFQNLNLLIQLLEKKMKDNVLSEEEKDLILKNLNLVPSAKKNDSIEALYSKTLFYLEVLNFFKLNNNLNENTSSINNSNLANDLYNILFKTDFGGNDAYIQAKKEVSGESQKTIDEFPLSFLFETSKYYQFWIKLIIDNKEISSSDKTKYFDKIFNFYNNNTIFEKTLSSTELNELDLKNFTESTNFFVKGKDIKSIPFSLLFPYETSKKLFDNPEFVKQLKEALNLSENSSKEDEQVYNWIYKNRVNFVYEFAKLSYFKKEFTVAKNKKVIENNQKSAFNKILKFVDSFKDDEEKSTIFNTFIKNNSTLNDVLSLLGFPKFLFSQVDNLLTPTASLWFSSNADIEHPIGDAGQANLTWIIKNRLIDFVKLKNKAENIDKFFEDVKERVRAFINDDIIEFKFSESNSNFLIFDLFFLKFFTENLLSENKIIDGKEVRKDIKILDISLKSLFENAINSVTSVVEEEKLIVFSDKSAYLAKVNQNFLDANNKEVYTGEIPENTDDFLNLLENQIDKKYIIDASGSKFLIVGSDQSADYLFPVINEENVQVNVSDQALVYLNSHGYERIRTSFNDLQEKDYFLVKLKDEKEINNFKLETEKYLSEKFGNSLNKKVYGKNELDFLNPERSLRISTAINLISIISRINLYIVIILSFLIFLSSLFIIKRYIMTRHKVIGILKAQGYSSIEIAISFLSFPFITSFLGTITGYLTSFGTQGIIKKSLSSYWTLPSQNLSFEPFLFFGIILIPFVLLSFSVVISALTILKVNPINLLNGIKDVNIGNVAQKAQYLFRKSSIKTKFIASLTINSFWKLFSLKISVVLASFISIFSISSNKIFETSVEQTYKHRNYKYKLDLETPTIEGGQYSLYSQDELDNLLYTPIGITEEAYQYAGGYFAKGRSENINSIDEKYYFKNGDPSFEDPHIISRSALNVRINSNFISFSPWEIVLNAMPDSQRARTLRYSRGAISALEIAQDLKYDQDFEYVGNRDNPDDYFTYIEDSYNSPYGKFWLKKWNKFTKNYELHEVNTVDFRDEYRQFLVDNYKKIRTEEFANKLKFLNQIKLDKKEDFKHNLTQEQQSALEVIANNPKHKNIDINEFFVGFNGVIFDDNKNEVYSFIKSNYNGEDINVYGYLEDSKYVQIKTIDDKDIIEELNKYAAENDNYSLNEKATNDEVKNLNLSSNDIYPIAVNYVFLNKNKLKIGSKIALEILNTTDRYQLKSQYKKAPKHLFKIVGVINTRINNELVASKKVIDKLTKLDILSKGKEIPFNGILSNEDFPKQTINSVSLYPHAGFSSINSKIQISDNDIKTNAEIFREIFVTSGNKIGTLKKAGLSDDDIYKIIFHDKLIDKDSNIISNEEFNELKKSLNLSLDQVENSTFQINKKDLIKQALENYVSIYSDNVYSILSTNVNSKIIEVGFVSSISQTISQLTIWIISIFFIVSIIILIMISTMIIAENEKNIAIFSILGYNNREKIKLFFGVYFPLIILATIISIPIVISAIAIFNSFIVGYNLIWLGLQLKWWHIIISSLIIILVFIVTSIISWIKLNKIKAIYIMKGK
ncbi:ABC transporter permease [[Mycoplasma] collis]|uniref:ABC transporter permease n=1 Tax=[Mycoplasma] collis TaxID=2127 RepID=UPI00051BC210|nr:ABC transporter permease [[Mycoplasma] collis]